MSSPVKAKLMFNLPESAHYWESCSCVTKLRPKGPSVTFLTFCPQMWPKLKSFYFTHSTLKTGDDFLSCKLSSMPKHEGLWNMCGSGSGEPAAACVVVHTSAQYQNTLSLVLAHFCRSSIWLFFMQNLFLNNKGDTRATSSFQRRKCWKFAYFLKCYLQGKCHVFLFLFVCLFVCLFVFKLSVIFCFWHATVEPPTPTIRKRWGKKIEGVQTFLCLVHFLVSFAMVTSDEFESLPPDLPRQSLLHLSTVRFT